MVMVAPRGPIKEEVDPLDTSQSISPSIGHSPVPSKPTAVVEEAPPPVMAVLVLLSSTIQVSH